MSYFWYYTLDVMYIFDDKNHVSVYTNYQNKYGKVIFRCIFSRLIKFLQFRNKYERYPKIQVGMYSTLSKNLEPSALLVFQ